MITVKVATNTGNSWITGINATEQGARDYFIGQWFNLGIDSDDMQRVISLEVIA